MQSLLRAQCTVSSGNIKAECSGRCSPSRLHKDFACEQRWKRRVFKLLTIALCRLTELCYEWSLTPKMPGNDTDQQLRAEEATLEKEQEALKAEKERATASLREIGMRLRLIDRRLKAISRHLDRKILKIEPSLPAGLSPASGITIAIRQLLQANQRLGPTAIRELLQRSGFPPGPNLLLTIHSTLKRLQMQGEIKAVRMNGRRAYMWVREPAGTHPSDDGEPGRH